MIDYLNIKSRFDIRVYVLEQLTVVLQKVYIILEQEVLSSNLSKPLIRLTYHIFPNLVLSQSLAWELGVLEIFKY